MKISEKYAFKISLKYLNERLRKIRGKLGLTQLEMAKKMDVSLKTYITFENVSDIPQWKHLNRFIEITNCDREWLLYGNREYTTNDERDDYIDATFYLKLNHDVKMGIEEQMLTINSYLKKDNLLRILVLNLIRYCETLSETDGLPNNRRTFNDY